MFIQSLSSCTKEDNWPNPYYGSLSLNGTEMRECRQGRSSLRGRFGYVIKNGKFKLLYYPLPFVSEEGSSFHFKFEFIMSVADFECEKQYTYIASDSAKPWQDWDDALETMFGDEHVEPTVSVDVFFYHVEADSGYILFKEGWNLEGNPGETTCAGIEFGFDFEYKGVVYHVVDGFAIPKPGDTTYDVW